MKYAKAGMSIFLADITEPALKTAIEKVKSVEGVSEVQGMTVDVSKVDEVVAMREKVLDVFGEVRSETLGRCFPTLMRVGTHTDEQRWHIETLPGILAHHSIVGTSGELGCRSHHQLSRDSQRRASFRTTYGEAGE